MTRLDNDLISRKALLEELNKGYKSYWQSYWHFGTYKDICSLITNAPTVEQDSGNLKADIVVDTGDGVLYTAHITHAQVINGEWKLQVKIGQEQPPPQTNEYVKAGCELFEADSEPVAFVITDEKINYLQKNTIKRLIDRAKRAHTADIKLRISGKDEWYQADWIKYMEIASPPKQDSGEPVGWMNPDNGVVIGLAKKHQVDLYRCFTVPLYTSPPKREWRGLTTGMIDEIYQENLDDYEFAVAIEAKLKEVNGYD